MLQSGSRKCFQWWEPLNSHDHSVVSATRLSGENAYVTDVWNESKWPEKRRVISQIIREHEIQTVSWPQNKLAAYSDIPTQTMLQMHLVMHIIVRQQHEFIPTMWCTVKNDHFPRAHCGKVQTADHTCGLNTTQKFNGYPLCWLYPPELHLSMHIIRRQHQTMCSPSAMTTKVETAGSTGLESNYVVKMSNLF